MIDRQTLLADLKPLLKKLEADLAERAESEADMAADLQAEYEAARSAERTSETYRAWRTATLTQAAVAWILGCVFVRFLEDNDLIETPWLSGPGQRVRGARDQQQLYFRSHPTDTDRDYLRHVFGEIAALPAMAKLYDRQHNPVWRLGVSGDAAKELIEFWRRVDPDTGRLIHDFTDPDWDTRFLGDLYQDLSEDAKKRYALLQTPEFVEEFILDQTLEPAIAEFGLEEVRMIDPTCGSGHFLIGGFRRFVRKRVEREPAKSEREIAQAALDAVWGVDLNPFAAAIARFRLLLEALRVSRIYKVANAPAYTINIATGDSLLHGKHFGQLDLGSGVDQLSEDPSIGHAFQSEDLHEVERALGQQYHVVVGNPPYITVKDKAANKLYRERWSSCHRQYSLGVPFTERFFDLARPNSRGAAGFVGLITANSFMKREFGKKLIEEHLPTIDLSHVVDTSGAYIPGHGTPTVILLGRQRSPQGRGIRATLGIRGEPSTPEDPVNGQVWSSIREHFDQDGHEDEWVSVETLPSETLASHPWSLAGGAAPDLFALVDSKSAHNSLENLVTSIGFYQDTHADEAFVLPHDFVSRLELTDSFRLQVRGDEIRDWSYESREQILFPFKGEELSLWVSAPMTSSWQWLYQLRSTLWSRRTFGGLTYRQEGRPWYDYHQFPKHRARTPLSIAFAFVATHNHFVLDRTGKVFNRSAPVIKLPSDATDADHLALVGLLNSSLACFWMKQVFHNKGGGGINEGHRGDKWEFFLEFTGTGLKKFPLPNHRPLDLAIRLDELAARWAAQLPDSLASELPLLPEALDHHRAEASELLSRMIALQEELDWTCYRLYDVLEPDLEYRDSNGDRLEPPPLALGERAFEIVMARQMAAGELETTWFKRHGSTPITDLPDHWPEDYRELVEQRIALIESERLIGLLERPEYKRRWNQESWEEMEQRALRGWLLDRLESPSYWPEVALQSARALADHAARDAEFQQVATRYRGESGFDLEALVVELVESESVPILPAQRYRDSGLRKRLDWEETWEKQRWEDLIDAAVAAEAPKLEDEAGDAYAERLRAAQHARKRAEVGDLPAPPKYKQADFLSATYWRLRGALDVPKERFTSFPQMNREADPTLLVGWAGWNALQRAQAIAAYFTDVQQNEGWEADRLTPLLAALREQVPWLKQWHNEVDPQYGERMGDFFEDFLRSQLAGLGLTEGDLTSWRPPERSRRRRATRRSP